MVPVARPRRRGDRRVDGGGAVLRGDDAAGLLDAHVAGAGHALQRALRAVIVGQVGAAGAGAERPGAGGRRHRRESHQGDFRERHGSSP